MDLFNHSDVFDHLFFFFFFLVLYNYSYNFMKMFIELYILELYDLTLYPYFSLIKCSMKL